MRMRRLFALFLGAASLNAQAADWSVRLQDWASERFESSGLTAAETERQSARIAWATTHAAGRTAIIYEHQPIDLEAGSPATNGFLHQVDVTHAMRMGRTRIDVSLGLHGSSNMFDDGQFLIGGGEMRSDALVGRFSVTHPVDGWFDAVGLAGDYRFGRFLVYPRLAKTFSLGDTELAVELPVSVAWRDPGGHWRLGLDRYGEHWATLDETETVEGKLYLDEWRITGRYRVWEGDAARLDFGAGLSFDTEVEYLDLDRGRVEGELDPALFAFVEISG